MACSCLDGKGYFTAASVGGETASLCKMFGEQRGAQLGAELERLKVMSPAEQRVELLEVIRRFGESPIEVEEVGQVPVLAFAEQHATTANELEAHLRGDASILPSELTARLMTRAVLPSQPGQSAALLRGAATRQPVNMVLEDGSVVHAHAIFFCDDCERDGREHFFCEGDQWYGCHHNTLCAECAAKRDAAV